MTTQIPNHLYWNASEVLVQTPTRNYTSADYEAFFTDIGYPTGWQMMQTSGRLLDDLRPPNVPVHCIYGHTIVTPKTFVYTKSQFPDTQPSIVYEQGDGTVNMRSLEVCSHWATQQPQPVVTHLIDGLGGEHIEILKSLDMVEHVRQVLYSDDADDVDVELS